MQSKLLSDSSDLHTEILKYFRTNFPHKNFFAKYLGCALHVNKGEVLKADFQKATNRLLQRNQYQHIQMFQRVQGPRGTKTKLLYLRYSLPNADRPTEMIPKKLE